MGVMESPSLSNTKHISSLKVPKCHFLFPNEIQHFQTDASIKIMKWYIRDLHVIFIRISIKIMRSSNFKIRIMHDPVSWKFCIHQTHKDVKVVFCRNVLFHVLSFTCFCNELFSFYNQDNLDNTSCTSLTDAESTKYYIS